MHNSSLTEVAQSAENVYLIFSANKSGEYFGYARMTSAIGEETSTVSEEPAKTQIPPPIYNEFPATIPTPATMTAPTGRIIDDLARGTIFWEADRAASSGEEEGGYTSGEVESGGETAQRSNTQSFGRSFRIQWLSTDRLPFYRTRGLRNPWNSNREVKIARDGTEIEPTVGRRLLSMFYRPGMYMQPPSNARSQVQVPRYTTIPQQHY